MLLLENRYILYHGTAITISLLLLRCVYHALAEWMAVVYLIPATTYIPDYWPTFNGLPVYIRKPLAY